MEKVSAEVHTSNPRPAKGILGYLIKNLKTRGKPPRKTLIGYIAAWVAFAVILWGIDFSSIIPTYSAKAVLAIIVWASIIWITEAIPGAISGLMIPMLLVVTKAVPKIPSAFSGFTLNVTFLCLGAFIFAAILSSAKLDTRIALTVLSQIKSTKVSKIILGLFSTCMGLALVIPAAVARSATLLPVVNGITALFGDTKAERNAKKAIVISSLVYAPMVGGIVFLTAHMPNVIMVGLFDKQLNIQISWVQWFWLHLPIVGLFPIMYLILKFFFKFQKVEVEGGIEKIKTAKEELGKTKTYEWTILFIFGAAATMWCLQDFHKIKTGMVTLMALGVFFIPGILPLKWKTIQDKTIWGTWLLLGGALSMSAAMGSTGLAGNLAAVIHPFVAGKGWIMILLIMMCGTQFIRLGMLSNVAAVAMLAPILIEMAPLLHMNTVAFTLLVGNLDTFAFVMPTQITAAVIAYSTGTFSMVDYAKVGFPIIICAILWSIFVMAPWYAMNGFPLWQPLVQ
ncbi:MAG: DASS family sodium-coupled anion symporter [Desulfocapsaceae bacterium]|nr:DASS family sodium-coupled anion symporter [Desulfocapsaceae bacterium]